jgi:DNA-binding GntR family transcriptional regulator
MSTTSTTLEQAIKPIQARTLSDQATELLRRAIQSGLLAPGAQMVERELAEQLGMSRVPVREAIQRLAEEGLVKRTTNRGTVVYLPSAEEIEEITSIRIVLEQFVAERLMQRWTPQSEAALRAIVDAMRDGVRERDRLRLADLDAEFHATMWRMAEHKVLMEMVSSLRQRVAQLLNETIGLMSDDSLELIIGSHEQLITALGSGQVTLAREEMNHHIKLGKEHILSAYQRRTAA